MAHRWNRSVEVNARNDHRFPRLPQAKKVTPSGQSEGINSKIQAIKRRVGGYRNKKNYQNGNLLLLRWTRSIPTLNPDGPFSRVCPSPGRYLHVNHPGGGGVVVTARMNSYVLRPIRARLPRILEIADPGILPPPKSRRDRTCRRTKDADWQPVSPP